MAASSTSEATMSAQDILPTLALSDIMHHLSPSPVDPPNNTTGHPNSPLPVSSADVLTMRGRLRELQTAALTGPDLTGLREAELLQMVSRLTETLPIDPAQLERQAETIGQLILQRDLIVKQAEEERARWQAERESWERTAEALILQRAKVSKSDDFDRQRGLWEAETRSLRDKVKEAENKVAIMEAEVAKLKPLLLMQPYSTSRLRQNLGLSSRDKGKRRETESTQNLRTLAGEDSSNNKSSVKSNPLPPSYNHHLQSASTSTSTLPLPPAITVTSPNSSLPFAPLSKGHPQVNSQPRRTPHVKSHKSSKNLKSPALTSDAMTAHLLLAAQRIGRQRASAVTGLMKQAEQEREEYAKEQEQLRLQAEQAEKEKLERFASNTARIGYYRAAMDSTTNSPQRGLTTSHTLPTMPKTPKRNSYLTQTGQSGGSVTSPSQFVFINASASTTPPGHPAPPTISRPSTSATSQTALQTTNPPTPLDSLLDAARSMMDSSGRRKAIEHPESPVPKRRRVSGAGISKANGKLTRVRSALEVLAEEAAAASGSGSKSKGNQLEEVGENRSGLLDAHLSAKGKGRATGASKSRERSLSTVTTTSNPSSSNAVRKSSRRRGSLQNLDESSPVDHTQPQTRTSDRLATKEGVPTRQGRTKRSVPQPTAQHTRSSSLSNVITSGLATSNTVARVIAAAAEYVPAKGGRRNTSQGRRTYTPPSKSPPVRDPSITNSDSTPTGHGHGDVNSESRREAREENAGPEEPQDSRAYSTAETITNYPIEQGRNLQHSVDRARKPRTAAADAVETPDGTRETTPTPDCDILAPEASHRLPSAGFAKSRVGDSGRGASNIVGLDADRDDADDDAHVDSDVDMLADDYDEYEGRQVANRSHLAPERSSSSHSPPLPKALPLEAHGSVNPGADDDQDADAEGEMDLGDGEGQLPGPTNSS
ncbi:hypothetical protein CVT24_011780 [Panaeolus cyanescens]|uniref:Uncharacterized protein n=1 Tax=Panaeolus cyanescens TaxID=181874 RepID=A0A409VHL4_9AGAR|nr:hypothetical protein CVT24_011780 [Panaeolus cyanescens]